jgi:hypothetical protein
MVLEALNNTPNHVRNEGGIVQAQAYQRFPLHLELRQRRYMNI